MTDLSDVQISFDYSGDDREEIIRNVKTILCTPLGTCPLYREFGIDTEPLDYPTDVAKNIMASIIIETVERWEPRVIVDQVTFGGNRSDGLLQAKVAINYAG